MPRRGPCSRPTPPHCRRAPWPASSTGPKSSWPSTSPSASGTRTSARSWATPAPTQPYSRACSRSPMRSASCPSPSARSRAATSSTACSCPGARPRSNLLVRGVSDFESIDRTWMITLQTGMGPFGMIDRMGLGVVTTSRNCSAKPLPTPGARVRSLHRRTVHPEGPPRGRKRPGLLPLPESGLRRARLRLMPRDDLGGEPRLGVSLPPSRTPTSLHRAHARAREEWLAREGTLPPRDRHGDGAQSRGALT